MTMAGKSTYEELEFLIQELEKLKEKLRKFENKEEKGPSEIRTEIT